MKRQKSSRHHLEDQEQKALIQWAQITPHPYLPGKIGDYLPAIPNGAHLASPSQGRKLKQLGMKPGVSDLFFASPARGVHGLWIEMKRPRESFDYPSKIKEAMSDVQIEWGERMVVAGYAFQFCYGWDEARCAIEEYLKRGG